MMVNAGYVKRAPRCYVTLQAVPIRCGVWIVSLVCKKIGLLQASNAVCIHLARAIAHFFMGMSDLLKMQIAFRIEKLIERADGKFAKVNGTDIGGSHFAAFCKAANKLCITPQQSLHYEDGKIDIAKLKKNLVMKELLELSLIHI